MKINADELLKEHERLNITRKIILSQLSVLKDDIDLVEHEIDEINKYIWKNLSSLNSDMDIFEQNFFDSQANSKYTEVLRNVNKIEMLRKSYRNAYFGRIDFKTEDDSLEVYVGYTTLVEGENFYIYDWRSPIASLFYNYGIGKASYISPSGEIKGKIFLKRQYKIEDDKIARCFDSNLNIDDEYLQEILSKTTEEKMSNIVSTIQYEQNKVIRNVLDKHLIVQGVAGSGKTSVGLHRIAYLLYKNLSINSNNVIILSPNELFSNYISNVLPELGEKNVLQTSSEDLFAAFIIKDLKKESYDEFLNKIYLKNKINKEIEYKFSSQILKDIKEFIGMFNKKLHFKSGIKVKNREFLKEELTNYLHKRCENLNISEKTLKVAEYICNIMNIKSERKCRKIANILKEMFCFKVSPLNLFNMFMRYESKYKNMKFIEIDSFINYEDIFIYLYIMFEMYGYPYDYTIKHIVIDEAQDYSRLQYILLKKIFLKSSFTILGDINQCINKYTNYRSLEELSDIFYEMKYVELIKSYRSSPEIIQYTNNILDIKNIHSVREDNKVDVSEKKCLEKRIKAVILKDIQILKEAGYKSIAIISRFL